MIRIGDGTGQKVMELENKAMEQKNKTMERKNFLSAM